MSKSVQKVATVSSIATDAFTGCANLETIIVAPGNSIYHSDGGCLIETATKKIVLGTGDCVIPTDGSVTKIGERAFEDCSSLTDITIPNGVTEIQLRAFYGCSNLESITIGSGVTSIGDYAFCNCSNLTDIYYEGTMDQWNNIDLGTSWNRSTGTYTIHCNDGNIEKS